MNHYGIKKLKYNLPFPLDDNPSKKIKTVSLGNGNLMIGLIKDHGNFSGITFTTINEEDVDPDKIGVPSTDGKYKYIAPDLIIRSDNPDSFDVVINALEKAKEMLLADQESQLIEEIFKAKSGLQWKPKAVYMGKKWAKVAKRIFAKNKIGCGATKTPGCILGLEVVYVPTDNDLWVSDEKLR